MKISKTKIQRCALAIIVAGSAWACDGSEDAATADMGIGAGGMGGGAGGMGGDAGGMGGGAGGMDVEMTTLSLSFENLGELGDAAVYEGWLIVDGTPVSTGVFTINADGDADPATAEVPTETADAAAMFVLTVEPADDPDPAPAMTHVLAGPFVDGTAALTIAHPAALNTDFADAAGRFILATPTSPSMDDETQGIWYLDPMAGPAATLELPELPTGWMYEGWVAGPDGPISTGRFTAAEGADMDGAGSRAGPGGAPPFPGQDFVDPALDLVGMRAVISVEPEPDDSPAPFALKPLVSEPITDQVAPVLQPFPAVNLDGLPMGHVNFR